MRSRWLSLSLLTLALAPMAQAQVIQAGFWDSYINGLDKSKQLLATAYVNALPVLMNPTIGMTAKETIAYTGKFWGKRQNGTSLGSGSCSASVTLNKTIIGVLGNHFYVHVQQLTPKLSSGCDPLPSYQEDPDSWDSHFLSRYLLPEGASSAVYKYDRGVPSLADALAEVGSYKVAGKNVNTSYSENYQEDPYSGTYTYTSTINLGAKDLICAESKSQSVDKGEFPIDEDFANMLADQGIQGALNGTAYYEDKIASTSSCGAVRPLIGKAGGDILSTVNLSGLGQVYFNGDDREFSSEVDDNVLISVPAAEDIP